MFAALHLSGKGERTQEADVREVRLLAQFYRKSPDRISEQELQRYFLHRKNIDGLAPASMRICDGFVASFAQEVVKRQLPWAVGELHGQGVEQFSRSEVLVSGLHPHLGSVASFRVKRFVVWSALQRMRQRRRETMAISFKGAHFPPDIILMGVRWYVAYPLSRATSKNSCWNVGSTWITRPSTDGWSNTARRWKQLFTAASDQCGSAGGWTRRISR